MEGQYNRCRVHAGSGGHGLETGSNIKYRQSYYGFDSFFHYFNRRCKHTPDGSQGKDA